MNAYFLGYTGSMQRRGVSNTSLAVTAEGRTLLVDLSGSPVQALKEADIDPATIAGVLLTHTHIDHIYALPSLLHQLWLGGRTEPLALISNGPTAAFAKRLIDLFDLERKKGSFRSSGMRSKRRSYNRIALLETLSRHPRSTDIGSFRSASRQTHRVPCRYRIHQYVAFISARGGYPDPRSGRSEREGRRRLPGKGTLPPVRPHNVPSI